MKKETFIIAFAAAFGVAALSNFAGCSGTENEIVLSDADSENELEEGSAEIEGEAESESELDAEAELEGRLESEVEAETSAEFEAEDEPAEETQSEYDEESPAESETEAVEEEPAETEIEFENETETEVELDAEAEIQSELESEDEGESAKPAAGLLVYFTNFVDKASTRFYPIESGAFGAERIIIPSLHTDAAFAGGGGSAFVIERMGADKVTILDVSTGSVAVKKTIFVGDGKTNAQYALKAAPGKIYVSGLASPEIAVYDAESGEKIKGIDLSAFADDKDGLPEIAGMIMAGGKVFAQVQALDSTAYYAPYGTSFLAVINPETDELIDADPARDGVQGIQLPARNPNGDMRVIGGLIYVNICENAYSADAGEAGIWTIDPASMTTVKRIISEKALSGGIVDFAVYDETRALAIISKVDFTVKVCAFNPYAGEFIKDVYDNSAWDANDVKADAANKLFFVATQKAILAFDAETFEEKNDMKPAISSDAGQPVDMLVLPAE